MKLLAAVAAALVLFTAGAFAEDTEKRRERNNKVIFGPVFTGQELEKFLASHPGYGKGEEVKWTKFNADPFDFSRVWAPAPEKMALSSKVMAYMPILPVTANKAGCGVAPRLLFLGTPANQYKLFVFEYVICDNTSLLDSRDLLNQYVAKYGIYDDKDYDRGMIIYKTVADHYRVGVSPHTTEEGKNGLMITVADSEVFSQAYHAWRIKLRQAGVMARSLF